MFINYRFINKYIRAPAMYSVMTLRGITSIVR